MKRNAVIAVGLFSCVFLSGFMAKDAAAVEVNQLAIVSGEATSAQVSTDPITESIVQVLFDKSENADDESTDKKHVIKHTVKSGETLTSIAKQHDTTWRRLYDKNTQIVNPDTITPDVVLIVPDPAEKLTERALPVSAPAPVALSRTSAASTSAYAGSVQTVSYVPRGNATGNSYYAGYCTWYAKSRRPDMPNNLGNADTWAARAAAQGFATGSAPRVGAIGQQGMHVVYVERVHGNGTVTISEMNYEGFGVVSSRTVAASNFRYIY